MSYNFSVDNNKLYWDYYWKWKGQQNYIKAELANTSVPISNGSAEEFIFEHYYGYAKAANNICNEYRVEHPSWNVHPMENFSIHCDFAKQYGEAFSLLNKQQPASVFAAAGSEVMIRSKTVIADG